MYAAIIGYILGILTRIKNQPSPKPNTHSTEQQNPASHSSPIIITYSPPPPTDEEIAEKKYRERRDKTKYRIEKWGLVVLSIYTAFTGFMAWEMKESTNATINFFRTDERAWIEIEPIKPIIFAPKSKEIPRTVFRYEIYPHNAGKTPARDVVMKAQEMGSGETFGSDEYSIESTQEKYLRGKFTDSKTGKPIMIFGNPIPRVLAPNTSAPVPFVLYGQEPQISQDGHGFYDYLVGHIDYVDQFGVPHWMKFCFFVINQRGELRYCEYGNDEER